MIRFCICKIFPDRLFHSAVVVVYDYHPNSKTLYDAHVKTKSTQFPNGHGRLAATEAKISERTLWSYIIQIASALKAVHDAGLAMRVIDPSKIIITGKNRYSVQKLWYRFQILTVVRLFPGSGLAPVDWSTFSCTTAAKRLRVCSKKTSACLAGSSSISAALASES